MPTTRKSYLSPSGDTLPIDWTPSTAGNHYSLVDDNPIEVPDDSDYVSTNVTGRQDTYILPNWPTWNQAVPGSPLIWIPSILIGIRAKSLNGLSGTKVTIYHNLDAPAASPEVLTNGWRDYGFTITAISSLGINIAQLDAMQIGCIATIASRTTDTIYVSRMHVEVNWYYRMQPGFQKAIWTP
jgi:hypothetical protein